MGTSARDLESLAVLPVTLSVQSRNNPQKSSSLALKSRFLYSRQPIPVSDAVQAVVVVVDVGFVVVVLTLLTRIIKSVVTGQAPVTLEELRKTPEKKQKQIKGGTRIYHN